MATTEAGDGGAPPASTTSAPAAVPAAEPPLSELQVQFSSAFNQIILQLHTKDLLLEARHEKLEAGLKTLLEKPEPAPMTVQTLMTGEDVQRGVEALEKLEVLEKEPKHDPAALQMATEAKEQVELMRGQLAALEAQVAAMGAAQRPVRGGTTLAQTPAAPAAPKARARGAALAARAARTCAFEAARHVCSLCLFVAARRAGGGRGTAAAAAA